MGPFIKLCFFSVFTVFFIGIFAQTGTLQIFSEIDSVDIYVDDIYQNIGTTTIDKIPIGSHYLKIKKDNIVIYSDLINITENGVTSILLRDTPEIRNKLLEALKEEIDSYKAERISVMAQMANNQVSSWYIKQGGKNISQKEFAEIINDKTILDKINRASTTATILRCIGTPLIIGGGFIYVLSFIKMIQEEPLYPGASTSTGAGLFNVIVLGALPLSTGLALCISPGSSQSYMTLDYAIEKTKEYNKNLRIKWGLPDDFEEL